MVVLAIGGVALRGLVGRGRAEREPSSGSSPATENQARGAELSSPLAAVGEDEAHGEARTAVEPGPAEVRAPNELEPPRGDARLRLEIVSREDQLALPGISLRLSPVDGIASGGKTSESLGRVGTRLVSDDAGRAEYLVDIGADYLLSAALGDGQKVETRLLRVPAFFLGEVRTLRVELGTRADLAWWGLAVDGETDLPLRDVSFTVLSSEPHGNEVFRDAQGSGEIEAEVATWSKEVVAVRSPGYATAYVLPSVAYRSRAEPQRVLLWREATLQVRVEGGLAPARVVVHAEHYECIQAEGLAWVGWKEFRWPAVPGEGEARLFEALPAKVELTVEAEVAGRSARRQQVTLEPGEHLELTWQLGSGATIEGRALDPDGKAAPGIEVWMLADGDFGRILETYVEDQVLGKATTDTDGRFILSDVAPGQYMVGPSPGDSDRDLDAVAPFATPVAIGPDDRVVPLTLICWRGLTIRGRVLGSKGEPALDARVVAGGEGSFEDASVESDGSFSLGPLVPGTYRVRAMGSGEASSVEVEAQAGDQGLELRLRAGGKVSVRVLDEDGRPVKDAELGLLPWGADLGLEAISAWQGTWSDAGGEGFFSGVLPGTYALQTTIGTKLALRTDLEVTAGGDLVVELVLAPAVLLTIRLSEREETVAFRLRWNGRSLRFGAFDGLEAEVLAPPGDVTVELVEWSPQLGLRVLQEKSLRLVLGQPASVLFDPLSDEPR